MPSDPYRTPLEPPEEVHETAIVAPLAFVALLLGLLIAHFAPHNHCDGLEPRGWWMQHGGGQGHGVGHR